MSQGLAQPEPERLLSADELAPILGMSLDWVYERAKAGDLPSSSYRVAGGSSFTPRFAKP
jgi:predicted DNA-binding transcriptional regulator AlpA